MNAKYTRKQILEAIKHWERQLKLGNFKKIDETAIEGTNWTNDPMKTIVNDNGDITVAQFHEMHDNLYPGQDDSPINVGVSGKNYGQVNQVLHEDNKCILTLAPYKNGRQSKDLSAGFAGPAIRMQKFMSMLSGIPSSCDVIVRMKDPYGFGPKALIPVEVPVMCITVDKAYGIFLRLED